MDDSHNIYSGFSYLDSFYKNTPKKYLFNKKVISLTLGILLLFGGVGMGVVLVSQPQLFNQSAQTISYCNSSGLTKCEVGADGKLTGNITVCNGTTWKTANCYGYGCANGKCLPKPPPSTCVGSGITKCEIGWNGVATGNLNVCAGGFWQSSSCAYGCGAPSGYATCLSKQGTGGGGDPNDCTVPTTGCPGKKAEGVCFDVADSCTQSDCFNGQCTGGKVCNPVTDKCVIPPTGLTSINNGLNGTRECVRISNTYCDGERMYEMYLWYKNQPNAWYNTGSTLTPARFFAMMLQAEGTGADTEFTRSIMTAATNQIWGDGVEHDPYCQSDYCIEGVFNFLGAYSESAVSRYNLLFQNGFAPDQKELAILMDGATINQSLAVSGLSINNIANQVVNNPPDGVAYGNDVPVHWGTACDGCNLPNSEWIQVALNTYGLRTNTLDRCGVYDVFPGGSVVFTLNQMHNWSLPAKDSPCY